MGQLKATLIWGASFRKCNVIGKFNLIKSFSIRLWADSFLRAYKSLTKLHISLYTYFNIVKQLAVSAWLSIHHQKPLTGCDALPNTPLYLDIICSHFGMMAFGMPVNAALRFSLADDSRKDSPLILCVGWRGTPSRKLHKKKNREPNTMHTNTFQNSLEAHIHDVHDVKRNPFLCKLCGSATGKSDASCGLGRQIQGVKVWPERGSVCTWRTNILPLRHCYEFLFLSNLVTKRGSCHAKMRYACYICKHFLFVIV